MAVVAAGVHPARVLRGKGQPGVLVDGQGIDVRPEGNGLLFPKVEPGAKRPTGGNEQFAV